MPPSRSKIGLRQSRHPLGGEWSGWSTSVAGRPPARVRSRRRPSTARRAAAAPVRILRSIWISRPARPTVLRWPLTRAGCFDQRRLQRRLERHHPHRLPESQCETRTMYRYQDMTTKTNTETHQTKYIDSISDLSPYAGLMSFISGIRPTRRPAAGFRP